MTDGKTRVARGAALLDRECPGWRGRVWPRSISIMAVDRCVLGQAYGDFYYGVEVLGLDGKGSREHGFLPYPREDEGELAAAWAAEVRGKASVGWRSTFDRVLGFIGF